MIKNQKQLTVTRQQLALLQGGIEKLRSSSQPAVLIQASIGSLNADIRKLENEINDYKHAESGAYDFSLIENVGSVGKQLVQARIARHLTQADLAKELGRKEQQIQRYEREQYSSASLETISRVAQVLNAKAAG